jgi:hypothetical protein
MPRRNRITPFGEIIATPERGTLMGNRGVLHDRDGRIRRAWKVKRWILCLLEFRGRRRSVMTPDRYTELFFLDEATGLAAGHRPCAECRRGRYNDFVAAWAAGNPNTGEPRRPTADEIDDRLHAERIGPTRSKRTFVAELNELPDGVFVTRDGPDARPLLIQGSSLLAWSPGGYRQRLPSSKGEIVTVLTPRSTVAAIRAGFVPAIHPSARSV